MNVEDVISLRNQIEDFRSMLVQQKTTIEKEIKSNDKKKNKVA